MRIFGSVSRNEQTEQSDLDICVETETPNPFLLADLKEFLEGLFKCSVDVVRIHKNMNPFFITFYLLVVFRGTKIVNLSETA